MTMANRGRVLLVAAAVLLTIAVTASLVRQSRKDEDSQAVLDGQRSLHLMIRDSETDRLRERRNDLVRLKAQEEEADRAQKSILESLERLETLFKGQPDPRNYSAEKP